MFAVKRRVQYQALQHIHARHDHVAQPSLKVTVGQGRHDHVLRDALNRDAIADDQRKRVARAEGGSDEEVSATVIEVRPAACVAAY
ncbi:hypothetical protein CBS63078_11143 [Aspergillus niger]|nr:hypothetical protein CBS13152_11078 [Aspergillus niger]KAI2871221.1 hypothetical protein CBS11852_11005 [Aspergillus niger]KAI2885621.1 hypothetical protein CBS63078_11143 [Aspergillus niger]KAI3015197.1 hypothetical protein CBS147347_11261 [Aspergillus niger]KAI3034202.1 hypothetical protein CBS76997_11118 [Aspergillus niger]